MTTILHRFSLFQQKWRKPLVYVNWSIAFVAFVVALLPLFIHGDQLRRGYPVGYFSDLLMYSNHTVPIDSATVHAIWSDDVFVEHTTLNYAFLFGPFVGMSIPPLLDLLVEVYVAITHSHPTTELNTNNAFTVVRLSTFERFIFIVGAFLPGTYMLLPTNWNLMVLHTVRGVTWVVTVIPLNVPLLIFLERTTNVVSPFFATFLIFLISMGTAMQCLNFHYAYSTVSHQSLAHTFPFVLLAYYVLLAVTLLWSFLKYLLRSRIQTTTEGMNEQLDPFMNFSTTHVPACHMVTLFAACIVAMCYVSSATPLPQPLQLKLYVFILFAVALVFVIEMRVRQNEVFSGLTQLDIKRYEAKLVEAEATANATIAEQEKTAKEREMQLTLELRENIINSAHDIKSPTTALGLAVESLLHALDSKKPLPEARRQRMIGTLHGMEHTIAVLTMIINRSVDACLSASAENATWIVANQVPLQLKQVMDEILAFSKWQADGSGIEVVMEPLPDDLPDEIMMDERWLKDDLLCLAGNVVKYSRGNQKTPAVMRVAIVPSPTVEGKAQANVASSSSVRFSFIDSGSPLSEERLTNLFNRPVHTERTQVGGMGLGLFCLSEHIKALQGQYGAQKRSDGREGTEIWFSIPLIVPGDEDLDEFDMEEVDVKKKEVASMKNDIKHASSVPTTVIDKSSFSSPQNRRASMAKSTLPLLNQFMGSTRDHTPNATNSVKEMVGGDIRIESTKKRESHEDSVTLRVADPVVPLNKRSSADRMQEVVGAMPILIVDDSVSILKMTKSVIQNECANISFIEAKNGKEAFERVAEAIQGFDLIVTDIQMPICNGFDFTRKVRQLERDKGLTPKMIIGISANDQQKISIEAKASGMDGFMHKPFKLSTLIDVIEEISNRRKQNLLQKMWSSRSFSNTGIKLPPTVANAAAIVPHIGKVVSTNVSQAWGNTSDSNVKMIGGNGNDSDGTIGIKGEVNNGSNVSLSSKTFVDGNIMNASHSLEQDGTSPANAMAENTTTLEPIGKIDHSTQSPISIMQRNNNNNPHQNNKIHATLN